MKKLCFSKDRCPVSLKKAKNRWEFASDRASWSKFEEFADEFAAADHTMEGLQEKSQRPHRLPNATPEDVIRKTGESRRMEGSAGHTVSGGEAVRQGGRGKPQPWRAGAAAVRQGALHCLLWNSRATTALRIC
jgi:hypothetical protein